MSMSIGIWCAALCTLAVYSFLFMDNRVYNLAEHLFVGMGAGYAIVMAYDNILTKAWNPMTKKGQIVLILPMLLGVLVFARFIRGRAYLSRIPLALLVGMGTALALRGTVQAEFVDQILATMIPMNTLDNMIIVAGTIGVLIYFFFAQNRDNPVISFGSKVGRVTMMASFGAAFGNGVMGRISLLISRMQLVFGDWIHLIK